MSGRWLALWLIPLGSLALAAPPELHWQGEYIIDGMAGGNLSGLARCGTALQAVSDRDDGQLYRLEMTQPVTHAQAESFNVPPTPPSDLPLWLRLLAWLVTPIRGGTLDYEGISCDEQGNRYLVSEAYAAVLKITASGQRYWLPLPAELLAQARANGMLVRFNALYEGLAIDPTGQRLWLAAERQRRGLLAVAWDGQRWQCAQSCVLLVKAAEEAAPADLGHTPLTQDFTDLVFFQDKLFTLERLTQRICRRSLVTGEDERCWSFAALAKLEKARYQDNAWGAEALALDAEGAWVGIDNNENARDDGERRPIVWRFAAPPGGWLAP